MNGPNNSAIKLRFNLSLNDLRRHDGTVIFHAVMMNFLLRPYATDVVIIRTDE